MAEVVVDSNVLFAFRNSRDQYHDRARPIVQAMVPVISRAGR